MVQPSKTQIGNKNVVRTIITIDKPSTAKTTKFVENVNHFNSSRNWKSKQKGSNERQIIIDILKIKRVQIKEKFLINETLFLLTKNNKRAPKAGSKQKKK